MNTLEHWQKSGSDFAAGVALLREHGPDRVTKSIMERLLRVAYTGEQPNAYELGKLTDALGKISLTPDPSPEMEGRRDDDAAHPTLPSISGEGSGVGLTSDRAKELHKLHSHHHTLMVTAQDDATRAEHATAIMEDIIPNLDEEYARLKGHGAASPTEAGKGGDDGVAKMRRLQSLRTRIGQLNNKLKKPKDLKQKHKYENELAEKTAEKERLESELS